MIIVSFRASSFLVTLIVTSVVTGGVVIQNRLTSVQPPQFLGTRVWPSTKMVTDPLATGWLVSGCVKISSSPFTWLKLSLEANLNQRYLFLVIQQLLYLPRATEAGSSSGYVESTSLVCVRFYLLSLIGRCLSPMKRSVRVDWEIIPVCLRNPRRARPGRIIVSPPWVIRNWWSWHYSWLSQLLTYSFIIAYKFISIVNVTRM